MGQLNQKRKIKKEFFKICQFHAPEIAPFEDFLGLKFKKNVQLQAQKIFKKIQRSYIIIEMIII
jgi:hypothetical protein